MQSRDLGLKRARLSSIPPAAVGDGVMDHASSIEFIIAL